MHERRTHSFSNMFYIIDTVCVYVELTLSVERVEKKSNVEKKTSDDEEQHYA